VILHQEDVPFTGEICSRRDADRFFLFSHLDQSDVRIALGLLLQQAERDPGMTLIQVAKEEEAIGVAAGAYFAGEKHILLMQNHGFLAAMNGIVSLAMLYGIPLCMLIALRGHWGEPYPWHTRGGIVTEGVLRALGIPFEHARDPMKVAKQIREAWTFSQSSLSPVALLLTRDLMED